MLAYNCGFVGGVSVRVFACTVETAALHSLAIFQLFEEELEFFASSYFLFPPRFC